PLTFPECVGAPLTEAPFEPPLAYKPALATAAIPAQEQSGPPRRPRGLAGCPDPGTLAATGTAGGAPPVAAVPKGSGLPATGAWPLSRLGPAAAAPAALAGPVGIRRRREGAGPLQ